MNWHFSIAIITKENEVYLITCTKYLPNKHVLSLKMTELQNESVPDIKLFLKPEPFINCQWQIFCFDICVVDEDAYGIPMCLSHLVFWKSHGRPCHMSSFSEEFMTYLPCLQCLRESWHQSLLQLLRELWHQPSPQLLRECWQSSHNARF